MKQTMLKVILFGLTHIIRKSLKNFPAVRNHVKGRRCIAQIKLKDDSIGRYYVIESGRITSHPGIHSAPDVTMRFNDLRTALLFLKPGVSQAEVIHAAKNFRVLVLGRDETVVWFMQLLNLTQSAGWELGTPMKDGTVRFTTNTNGGPLFVYVKDDKIVRMTPIDLDNSDAPSWTITARGKKFTPQRRGMINPHAMCLKSLVYSDKRILHPMKRVDFDPNGERNIQNRGKSEYVRISWDEALDIVANEITRQKKVHGPGAMALFSGSHHQWGNVGYYLSAMLRFGNLVGFTRVHPNPDSWEGWYWGAQHHFGNSLRVGLPGFSGLVEDCLKEAEQIVFWSSDPETTNGYASGLEGTQRRFWAKELGIDFIHIDPHLNPTAQLYGGRWIPIKPATDPALALAIMYVWIKEGLYDKDYVASRTTGFDAWKAYVMGEEDGIPKTPEWQEPETGVPAKDVRALARSWGKKKTYLAAGGLGTGFGGACRSATGSQWARHMILLMAMQGLGKPGINFGNLQAGTPLDHAFWFPGYAEGGISGELNFTAGAVNTYCRMPHVLTMNPVKQMIPRQRLPDAIVDGYAKGYLWDGSSLEAQFAPYEYPMPGYSKVHMLYRYGASSFGTVANSDRFVEMYRHESLECVVNQSIWFEGEAQFADVILPACTSFERVDISDWGNSGGYIHHNTDQINHRMVIFQHKCIEPLGESKSDYQIFLEILNRLGLGAMFSEGCSELDWCKRMFEASDLVNYTSWKEFIKKGYFVVPAEPEKTRDPAYFRWFAEDRHKDVPEPVPLPSQWSGEFGKGLQTQSGKIEFVSSSIQRGDPNNPERPALNRYIPSWEGPQTSELFGKYPLQMVSTHSRYSFHTYGDGKDSTINDIEDHRILVDGYYYWVMRMNPEDARQRGVNQHDLIRVFNDRGNVVCVVDISPLIAKGVVKAFESSAEYDIFMDPRFGRVDRGGCVNTLTPRRAQVKNTDGMGSNSCLVNIERWIPSGEALVAA
ncbi:molybdopterin-dependent oxidoreductase [Ferribacterium limneticum]|uniref:molybdopterin-dependent oxidoreductase n=1 Tax=Ferribacterium limneticum TaxID=76259 RepID=UPI001CF9DB8B|nr:molybdopterin-dependent oxidoreductase [Ferribacterium limneticum]UCV17882.1 molybdopterin-dependent oxidoreductase [Ferribacterium limneticum]